MKNTIIFVFLLTLASCNEPEIIYPESKKVYLSEKIFGHEIDDNYRWLEDFTSDESEDWIERQNNFTKTFISRNKYQKRIKSYLNKVWESESLSIPFRVKDKTFYYFNDGTFQQSKLMVLDCQDCDPRTLIDPNLFSNDGTVSLAGVSVSNNARLIAFSTSDGGSDWRVWKVMNIDTGEVLKDEIKWAKFSGATWENDDSGFYYQRYAKPLGEALKDLNDSPKLMFHKIGTMQSDDKLIFENPQKPRWGFGLSVAKDSGIKILSISEGTDERNRIFIKLNNNSDFVPVVNELKGTYNFIDSKGDELWFYTTDGSPNGKVVSLKVSNNQFSWKTVIQESTRAIKSVDLIDHTFIVNYLKDTLSEIHFYNLYGDLTSKLNLDKSISGFEGSIDDEITYFSETDYVSPRKIYQFDFTGDTFGRRLYWSEVLDGYSHEEHTSRLVFYKSKDGTKIPLNINYANNTDINENTPVLLYGYGGFDISILPRLNKSFLAWMNQGGVVAIANLRGGGEYGEDWHRDGMLLNKQNVFDDFAYAAKYLHKVKIGSPNSTAILGRSNGGLLVAATMLQNPDLFKIAIPEVGVLDMLRYHKFTIGWAWASDYGSPDEEIHFNNLLSYSPLHNIAENNCYPATLITTAKRDDRVVPSHSFKFAAKLQSMQSCDKPILIRIEERAGHGAGTPKDKRINQISEVFGYALKVIND